MNEIQLGDRRYDVHGKNHTGQYSIDEGSKIEL